MVAEGHGIVVTADDHLNRGTGAWRKLEAHFPVAIADVVSPTERPRNAGVSVAIRDRHKRGARQKVPVVAGHEVQAGSLKSRLADNAHVPSGQIV
jgi:hypothetical protein